MSLAYLLDFKSYAVRIFTARSLREIVVGMQIPAPFADSNLVGLNHRGAQREMALKGISVPLSPQWLQSRAAPTLVNVVGMQHRALFADSNPVGLNQAIPLRDRTLKNRSPSAFKATFCPSKLIVLGALCCEKC